MINVSVFGYIKNMPFIQSLNSITVEGNNRERESARVNHRLPPIFWEENVRGGNYAIEEGEMYLH